MAERHFQPRYFLRRAGQYVEGDLVLNIEIDGDILTFQPVGEMRQKRCVYTVQRQFPVRQGVFVE